MSGEVVPDVLDQILIQLSVKDLIRFKSVCKSWQSLISTSGFIQNHLIHSYNKDRNNKDFGYRRVIRGWSPFGFTPFHHESDYLLFGSSNGLVACISLSDYEVLVANPSTREAEKLLKPQAGVSYVGFGFGYDSFKCDYKVILGSYGDGDTTCFQVLNFNSNVWKAIRHINYTFVATTVGVLYNGALHWVMKDQSKKTVIISFHLSQEEEFREIPIPDNDELRSYPLPRLGILEECLCIFSRESSTHLNIWMMKNYFVDKSWELVERNYEIKHEVIHCLSDLRYDIPYERSLCHDIWFCKARDFIGMPIFVQSLVYPHIYKRPKRKQQVENNKMGVKLLKGDSSVSGPSAMV